MKNGTFVLDAHTGFWDASKENCKNRFGDAFIETFYAFHNGFNPPDKHWTMDYEKQFRKVDPDWYLEEVFVKGDADMSILSTQVLMDFYHTGFANADRNAQMRARAPERIISLGGVDPLSLFKFDVRDIDEPAWLYPELNFIIDHVGLPRLDDFCWIAARCPNVYGSLAVALAFVHTRPRFFAEVMANLLFWLGPERIVYGTDFPIWYPHWQLDDFMAFQLPEDIKQEYGVNLTDEIKQKIIGGNIARLYGIEIDSKLKEIENDEIAQRKREYAKMAHDTGIAGTPTR